MPKLYYIQIYIILNFANFRPMFILIMVNRAYFVKSTPSRAFSVFFDILKVCYRYIVDVHEGKNDFWQT